LNENIHHVTRVFDYTTVLRRGKMSKPS